MAGNDWLNSTRGEWRMHSREGLITHTQWREAEREMCLSVGVCLSVCLCLSICLSLSVPLPFPITLLLSTLHPIFQCSSLCTPHLLSQPSDVSIDVKVNFRVWNTAKRGRLHTLSSHCSLYHWQPPALSACSVYSLPIALFLLRLSLLSPSGQKNSQWDHSVMTMMKNDIGCGWLGYQDKYDLTQDKQHQSATTHWTVWPVHSRSTLMYLGSLTFSPTWCHRLACGVKTR